MAAATAPAPAAAVAPAPAAAAAPAPSAAPEPGIPLLSRAVGLGFLPLAAAGVHAAAAVAPSTAGNAAIAALTHESGAVIGHGIHPGMCYNMPDDVRERVLAASGWMDLIQTDQGQAGCGHPAEHSVCRLPAPGDRAVVRGQE